MAYHGFQGAVDWRGLGTANGQVDDTLAAVVALLVDPIQTCQDLRPLTGALRVKHLHRHDARLLVDTVRLACNQTSDMGAMKVQTPGIECGTNACTPLKLGVGDIDKRVHNVHQSVLLVGIKGILVARWIVSIYRAQVPWSVVLTLGGLGVHGGVLPESDYVNCGSRNVAYAVSLAQDGFIVEIPTVVAGALHAWRLHVDLDNERGDVQLYKGEQWDWAQHRFFFNEKRAQNAPVNNLD